MADVLIVEDDPDVREILKRYLEIENFVVDEAETLFDLRNKMAKNRYRILILDLMLPDGLAISEIPKIRASRPEMGILVLSARDTDLDVITGIEFGADDYVTKPFNPREVVARIRAILRRLESHGERMVYDGLEIEPKNLVVKVNGRKVDLSATEFKILLLMASEPNRVFTREQILRRVWNEDSFISDRVVDVHISSLRSKIGKNWIKTVRGIGYKFNPEGSK